MQDHPVVRPMHRMRPYRRGGSSARKDSASGIEDWETSGENVATMSLLDSIQTPAFLVDRPRVRRNCDRMLRKATESGVAFRPHVKTHKVPEIGRMQHGGAVGWITVSTLAEAEAFARDGFRDITYAVPIAPEKLERV